MCINEYLLGGSKGQGTSVSSEVLIERREAQTETQQIPLKLKKKLKERVVKPWERLPAEKLWSHHPWRAQNLTGHGLWWGLQCWVYGWTR